MKRSYFRAVGTIGWSRVGGAWFSGPPGSTPISGAAGGAERAAERASEDLAGRKGIDKGEITVVAVEGVNCADTSLGCPELDMMYAQVITPGYRIVLSYSAEIHVYHSDRGDRVVYCQSRPA